MNLMFRSMLIPVALVLLLSLSDCVNFSSWISDTASDRMSPAETDDDDASPSPTPRLTPHPTVTPRPTSTSRPTITVLPTSTPEPGFTQRDLERLLLGPGDLPPGWSVASVSDPPTEVPGVDHSDALLVSEFFQRSDLGPFLVHMLLLTETESEARSAFRAIEGALDDAEILDDVTDQVRSWETEPADFVALGDDTFAFKAIGDTGIIPVDADVVAVRQGRFISFVIHAEMLRVDTELTEELVRTAVERLPDAD